MEKHTNANLVTSENDRFIALSSKGSKFDFQSKPNGSFKYKNQLFDFKVTYAEDGFTYIELNGQKYAVELVSVNQNKYEVLINSITYVFTVETPFSLKRKDLLKKQAPQSKVESIPAPMPGKILDVLVEEGAAVNEGDALLVLEAMKMQNEITSHIKGKVKKIFIKKGENVMKDDVMIEIERN